MVQEWGKVKVNVKVIMEKERKRGGNGRPIYICDEHAKDIHDRGTRSWQGYVPIDGGVCRAK